jgi:hypothetical protein
MTSPLHGEDGGSIPSLPIMDIPENVYEADASFRGKQVYWKEYSSQRKKVIPIECEYCGNTSFQQLSHIKSGKGKYCSRSCAMTSINREQTGEDNPRYLGKQDFVEKVKENGECNICGEERAAALCFHHKEPESKELAVSRMSQSSGYSLQEVKEEVEKCELICFNCHEVHYSSTKAAHP